MSGAVCNRSFVKDVLANHFGSMSGALLHGWIARLCSPRRILHPVRSSAARFRARFSLIENAAHLARVEQPEIMAERMMDFFREVKIV